MSLDSSVSKVFKKSIADGELDVPSSKSWANRMLILASLSRDEITLRNLPKSTDVINMIQALRKVGLEIEELGPGEVKVKNSFPECELESEKIVSLETGDGGTTNRFLVPLLARGKNTYEIIPGGKLKERPQHELVDILKKLNVSVEEGLASNPWWIRLKGPIESSLSKIEIDCKDSTQFASAALMALWNSGVEIEYKNLETSVRYLEMTEDLIKTFSSGETEFAVPIDFSSAGYPIALGCLFGKVKIKNFYEIDTFQADSKFIEILKSSGGRISENEGLLIEKSDLLGASLDCSMFPDLVPTLAFVFAYARGETRLRNIEVLIHKESNRLEEILTLFKLFEIEHKYDEAKDELLIVGRETTISHEVEYKAPDDHRMVMVGYLFMRFNAGGTLHNAVHVKKSFPNFFEVMESL